jgi:non-ribosomal peptide synthetase component F
MDTPDQTTLQTPRDQPVHELLAIQAARRPDALAVSAPDATLTHAELARRSALLARRLAALGVTAGEVARTDPLALRDWLIAERITVTFASTTLAETIVAFNCADQFRLGYLLTGGGTG